MVYLTLSRSYILVNFKMLNQDKIILLEEYRWASRNRKNEIKKPHKDYLLYLIRIEEEKHPTITSSQAKARGVQNFLRLCGLKVLCIDSFSENGSGLMILDETTQEEIAFIKTNSVLINVIYDLYFSGLFSASGGPKAENKLTLF